jgi:hypothetical protein
VYVFLAGALTYYLIEVRNVYTFVMIPAGALEALIVEKT